MKVVLAISGGVDSMVMLDIMAYHLHSLADDQWQELNSRGYARARLVAATYDHGTRTSAEDDTAFVQRITANKYGLPCFVGRGDLGENVAEAEAREHRYDFLHNIVSELNSPEKFLAKRPDMKPHKLPPVPAGPTYIYTAHHLDDLVESIAINLARGTGWRGLAVLDTPGIKRPFLDSEAMPEALRSMVPFDKKRIYAYAASCEISFRQDPTNNEDNYLRNRLREKLTGFNKKKEIYNLWLEQKRIKHEIDAVVEGLLPEKGKEWQRSWFRNLDEKVAIELLRAGTLRAGVSATRPQLKDFLQAILTYGSGKSFNLPQDRLVKFSKTGFTL